MSNDAISDQSLPDERRTSDDPDNTGKTDLSELNDDGVGGTLGPKDHFEPEESLGKEG